METATRLWLGAQPLVLASQSVTRRALLESAGLCIETKPADLDERGIEARAGALSADAAAALLARAKAEAVAANNPGRLVLGADQTLALGNRRFSKPADRAAARAQLAALRGATHSLHSGIALVRDGAALFEHVETARLTMRDFSDDFLDRYLDEAGPAASASVGGYQIESLGVHLFARVEGDHSTILGLPLAPLLARLRALGQVAD